jgi:hypothetical protein
MSRRPGRFRVLVFERAKLSCRGNLHAPELRLVFVEGRVRDPVLPADIRGLRPASCSFKIPIICSSVNRDRFIV